MMIDRGTLLLAEICCYAAGLFAGYTRNWICAPVFIGILVLGWWQAVAK